VAPVLFVLFNFDKNFIKINKKYIINFKIVDKCKIKKNVIGTQNKFLK